MSEVKSLYGIPLCDETARANIEILNTELTASISAEATTRSETISSLQSEIQSEVTSLSEQDALLSARIDSLATLEEGSTTGDAELIDARIGIDGTVYENVGSAIRTQISTVNDGLIDVYNDYYMNYGYNPEISIDRDNITITPLNGSYIINGTPTANIGFEIKTFTPIKNHSLKISCFDEAHATSFVYVTDLTDNSRTATCYGGTSVEFDVLKDHTYTLLGFIAGATLWNNVTTDIIMMYPYNVVDTSSKIEMFPFTITSSNMSKYLADVNNAKPNTRYRISARSIPANMPANLPNPLNCYFETLTTDAGNIQYIKDLETDKVLWQRYVTAEWLSHHHEITVGKGSGAWDYTKLYDALKFASLHYNTTITVYDGTYDLIEEIGDEIENIGLGILVGKNTVINFKPHAYVICNYEGDNENIKNLFSPLNAGVGDFEINNMKIYCSNVRYCVHDERSTAEDPYSHKYNNCEFYLDNRNNSVGYPQCIGGGLGKNGHIEIIGCSFESETISENGEKAEASYHNSSASDSKSEVFVKDSYFKNGTFRISYYGSSTEITYAYVNNNSVKYTPFVSRESEAYDIQNVVLREWNNTIHN